MGTVKLKQNNWSIFDKQTNKTKIIGLYLPDLVRTQCPLSSEESQPEKCHWSSKAFSENMKFSKQEI